MIVRRISYFTFMVAITTMATVTSCHKAMGQAKEHIAAASGPEEHELGLQEEHAGTLELVRALRGRGLKPGKIRITRNPAGGHDEVHIYLVINKDYKGQVSAGIFENTDRCYAYSAPAANVSSVPRTVAYLTDIRKDIVRKNRIQLE